MAGLTLKHIYKIYPNGTKAVNDFSMEIEDKEFIVFVGPSGCGKSTTLRMIAGLEEISAGELKIGGRVVNDVDCKERDTAMVFQNYALYPHFTVYENIAFPLKMSKLPKEQIREKVLSAAKILGLEDYLDKKPASMSGGQRQRVALGRAIVREPQVFLLDEPLSNLDAKLRTQMRSEITKLHQRLQTTFVYVTHDQTEAMTMGDRIVVMKAGRIQQIDTPVNLYNYPVNKFVAGFIGTPPMNFYEARVAGGEGGFLTIEFADDKKARAPLKHLRKLARAYLAGKPMTLGIRPENISVSETDESGGIPCVVNQTEILGGETLLYCDFDTKKAVSYEESPNAVVIKAAGMRDYRPGTVLFASFDFSKAHFFDKETEECISLRVPLCNETDVCISAGKLSVGGAFLALPPELSSLSGEYEAKIPVDAVRVTEYAENALPAVVTECEKIADNRYLLRAEAGPTGLYLLSEKARTGTICLSFAFKKIEFVSDGETIKPALDEWNFIEGKLVKRKLPKRERTDGSAFAVDFVFGERSLPCPKSLCRKLLSASDRKIFGIPVRLEFISEGIAEGESFAAEPEGLLDYGEEKFVVCTVAGNRMRLSARCLRDGKVCFDIDMENAAVVETASRIRLA